MKKLIILCLLMTTSLNVFAQITLSKSTSTKLTETEIALIMRAGSLVIGPGSNEITVEQCLDNGGRIQGLLCKFPNGYKEPLEN